MLKESQLRWLCRRGMKELDLVMGNYLEHYYATADTAEQQGFQTLLKMSDPDLFALLVGRGQAADLRAAKLIQRLRHHLAHKKNC